MAMNEENPLVYAGLCAFLAVAIASGLLAPRRAGAAADPPAAGPVDAARWNAMVESVSNVHVAVTGGPWPEAAGYAFDATSHLSRITQFRDAMSMVSILSEDLRAFTATPSPGAFPAAIDCAPDSLDFLRLPEDTLWSFFDANDVFDTNQWRTEPRLLAEDLVPGAMTAYVAASNDGDWSGFDLWTLVPTAGTTETYAVATLKRVRDRETNDACVVQSHEHWEKAQSILGTPVLEAVDPDAAAPAIEIVYTIAEAEGLHELAPRHFHVLYGGGHPPADILTRMESVYFDWEGVEFSTTLATQRMSPGDAFAARPSTVVSWTNLGDWPAGQVYNVVYTNARVMARLNGAGREVANWRPWTWRDQLALEKAVAGLSNLCVSPAILVGTVEYEGEPLWLEDEAGPFTARNYDLGEWWPWADGGSTNAGERSRRAVLRTNLPHATVRPDGDTENTVGIECNSRARLSHVHVDGSGEVTNAGCFERLSVDTPPATPVEMSFALPTSYVAGVTSALGRTPTWDVRLRWAVYDVAPTGDPASPWDPEPDTNAPTLGGETSFRFGTTSAPVAIASPLGLDPASIPEGEWVGDEIQGYGWTSDRRVLLRARAVMEIAE